MDHDFSDSIGVNPPRKDTLSVDAKKATAKLAHSFLEQGDATGWFEAVYRQADGDSQRVPWAHERGHPLLTEWLEGNEVDGDGKTALVVGCGLGDDAEELAHRGFSVTAFDISKTAIAWCLKRFPTSTVSYQVVDLFETPTSWHSKFDLVLEVYTLQALPLELRRGAMTLLPRWLSSDGRLLVICRGRADDEPLSEVPWPLSKSELAALENRLIELSFEILDRTCTPEPPCFRALYGKRS
jgi:SAM-dependent methyltransferase